MRPYGRGFRVDTDDVAGVLDYLLGDGGGAGRAPVVVVIGGSSDELARPPAAVVPRMTVDVDAREVRIHGRLVSVSPREWDVLQVLATRPGSVVARPDIIRAVWPDRPEGKDSNLDNALFRLRRKLEVDPTRPRHLVAIRGRGLLLELTDGGEHERTSG